MYARVKKRLVNGDIITGSRTNFRPPPPPLPGNNRFGDSTRATELPPRLAARSLGIPPQLVILSWLLKFGLSRSGCPVTSTTLLPSPANFCKRSRREGGEGVVARSLQPAQHARTLVRNFAGWPVRQTEPSSFLFPFRGKGMTIAANTRRIEFQFQTARSAEQILSY